MQLWSYGLGFVVALGLGAGLGGGCAASNGPVSAGVGVGGGGAGTTGTSGGAHQGGGGQSSSAASGKGGGGGVGGGVLTDSGVPDGFGACATFSAQAQQAPAAMLVVLQRSSSMANSGKWPASQTAIVQAIDEDVFDTMSLGFSGFPSGYKGAPACLCPGLGPTCDGILPFGVACGFPSVPQIALVPAGTQKSTASTGVRHTIAQWLADPTNGPEMNDPSNATPMYDTLVGAYQALQALTGVDKRILALISDGGGSCTSLSNRTASAISDGQCPDWESPITMNTLISGAQTDPSTPVDTFIVGVPGSNSHGESVGAYSTAPYSMLLALSTYAVSGSPSTVDPSCDSTAVWTQTGADPAHPCHIDLSNGANFNAAALASAIATLRGKDLGCVYDLPTPPVGQTISKSEVNVEITIDGTTYLIPKRKNPTDQCLTSSDPCWDYDANGKVDLIGITCSTVSTSASAEVEIFVGCATVLN